MDRMIGEAPVLRASRGFFGVGYYAFTTCRRPFYRATLCWPMEAKGATSRTLTGLLTAGLEGDDRV